jgi:hypothetical protein
MLVLAAGLSGAFGAAQFPAFSQQYLQRLGGAVDALGVVVAEFDASASAEGLTRIQALAQMQGTDFVERRRADMTRAITRYDTLKEDLAVLEGHGPFMRAYHGARLTDPEVAKGAWAAFQPALPLSLATAIFAGVGYLCAVGVFAAILALIRTSLRRRPLPA